MIYNKIIKETLDSVLNLSEFVLKNETKGNVEYENSILVISFTYDFNRSFEVDVNFHFKANDEFYTFAELKEYFGEEKNLLVATQILDENKFKNWTLVVKQFLENHLNELIKNHLKICFELDGLRRQIIADYNNDQQAKFFKEDAFKFWKDKDYVRLVELVKKYRGNLDGSLKKKYEYALKMLSK